LARPLVKSKEINSGKGIGGVDGAGDENKNPQPNIRERRETRRGFEVGEVLRQSVYVLEFCPVVY
jgi:hypothetical protein